MSYCIVNNNRTVTYQEFETYDTAWDYIRKVEHLLDGPVSVAEKETLNPAYFLQTEYWVVQNFTTPSRLTGEFIPWGFWTQHTSEKAAKNAIRRCIKSYPYLEGTLTVEKHERNTDGVFVFPMAGITSKDVL
jgi:hypothetical protein